MRIGGCVWSCAGRRNGLRNEDRGAAGHTAPGCRVFPGSERTGDAAADSSGGEYRRQNEAGFGPVLGANALIRSNGVHLEVAWRPVIRVGATVSSRHATSEERGIDAESADNTRAGRGVPNWCRCRRHVHRCRSGRRGHGKDFGYQGSDGACGSFARLHLRDRQGARCAGDSTPAALIRCPWHDGCNQHDHPGLWRGRGAC